MSASQTSAAALRPGAKCLLYVGTYGKGIYGYRFDPAGPKLEPLELVGEVVNPSFLATDRNFRYLYAVSELEGKVNGGVAAFQIDRHTGKLKLLNSVSSGGEAPCHLAVDHSTKMLLVANYGTGGVAAFPIEHDGRLGNMSDLAVPKGSSVNPERQQGPHAHEIVISQDNQAAYVPDLGLDQVRIYKLDLSHAKLEQHNPPFIQQEAGYGPRHMAFSSNGKFLYVVNELKSYVTVFSHNLGTGSFRSVQQVSTLPSGFTDENAPAEIQLDAGGRFLYASNRGPGTIAVFSVDPGNGTLRQIQIAQTGGTWPRGFEIDPTGRWLLSGDQKSNQVLIFGIDPTTGHLNLTGQVFQVPSPVSFTFVPAD